MPTIQDLRRGQDPVQSFLQTFQVFRQASLDNRRATQQAALLESQLETDKLQQQQLGIKLQATQDAIDLENDVPRDVRLGALEAQLRGIKGEGLLAEARGEQATELVTAGIGLQNAQADAARARGTAAAQRLVQQRSNDVQQRGEMFFTKFVSTLEGFGDLPEEARRSAADALGRLGNVTLEGSDNESLNALVRSTVTAAGSEEIIKAEKPLTEKDGVLLGLSKARLAVLSQNALFRQIALGTAKDLKAAGRSAEAAEVLSLMDRRFSVELEPLEELSFSISAQRNPTAAAKARNKLLEQRGRAVQLVLPDVLKATSQPAAVTKPVQRFEKGKQYTFPDGTTRRFLGGDATQEQNWTVVEETK